MRGFLYEYQQHHHLMVCTRFDIVLLHLVLLEETGSRLFYIVNFTTIVKLCDGQNHNFHLHCFVIIIHNVSHKNRKKRKHNRNTLPALCGLIKALIKEPTPLGTESDSNISRERNQNERGNQ